MFRRDLPLLILLLGLGWGIQPVHAAGPGRAKAAKPPVKQVRQKDGSVMVRLDLKAAARSVRSRGAARVSPALAPQPADSPLAQQARLMEQWLDAMTEPRLMTALAAVAIEPGADARAVYRTLDPTTVRNWAEFVDPELLLRWRSPALDPRVSPAILDRTRDAWMLPQGIVFPIDCPVPRELQPGAPLAPTLWSHAYDGGSGGREAVEAWLKLPMPDAGSNPWLRSSRNYRY